LLSPKIIAAEKYFFLLLVFLHVLPVLLIHFFVTHDGPSHVYNSFILNRLFSGDALTAEIFMLNPAPEPNWLGHFIMMAADNFFSGNISERILIGIYIVTFPIFFRSLVLVINPKAAWTSYLILPFIYSFLLHIGFYNFCIGLPVLFLALSYFLKNWNAIRWKQGIILSFLLVLLYFSHIFLLMVFFITVFTAMMQELFSVKQFISADTIKRFVSKAFPLFLSCLPVIFLSVVFILRKSSAEASHESRSFSELFQWLTIARPVVTLKYDGEEPFGKIIAACTGVLMLTMLFLSFKKKVLPLGHVWAICAFIFLALYFFFPDKFATGGFISMRLLLAFYLFLLLWFAAGEFHRGFKLSAVTIFLFVSGYFLQYHYKELSLLSDEAEEYYSLAEHIKENAVVMPIEYSSNWMHNNLATYLGTRKNILVLDNYEAQEKHFPVLWKDKANPYLLMGEGYGGNPPCADIDNFETASGKKVNYVMRWLFTPESSDSCTMAINKKLENDFEKIFVSARGKAELFVRKNR